VLGCPHLLFIAASPLSETRGDVMSVPVKIDFVSDVACPWCAVGLKSLEAAIARVGGELHVELRFQPFELNPQMPAEGEDAVEHLTRKYGITAEQAARNGEAIRARGAEPLSAIASVGSAREPSGSRCGPTIRTSGRRSVSRLASRAHPSTAG
jgi:hypothetical protein